MTGTEGRERRRADAGAGAAQQAWRLCVWVPDCYTLPRAATRQATKQPSNNEAIKQRPHTRTRTHSAHVVRLRLGPGLTGAEAKSKLAQIGIGWHGRTVVGLGWAQSARERRRAGERRITATRRERRGGGAGRRRAKVRESGRKWAKRAAAAAAADGWPCCDARQRLIALRPAWE